MTSSEVMNVLDTVGRRVEIGGLDSSTIAEILAGWVNAFKNDITALDKEKKCDT